MLSGTWRGSRQSGRGPNCLPSRRTFWLAVLTGTVPVRGPGHNAGHRVYPEEDSALYVRQGLSPLRFPVERSIVGGSAEEFCGGPFSSVILSPRTLGSAVIKSLRQSQDPSTGAIGLQVDLAGRLIRYHGGFSRVCTCP